MQTVLLLARDPLQAGDGAAPIELARAIRGQGHEVVLVLLEDAVVLARAGHRHAAALAEAVSVGVRVLAEDEALSRRAVVAAAGIKPTGFGEIVDLLLLEADRQAWL